MNLKRIFDSESDVFVLGNENDLANLLYRYVPSYAPDSAQELAEALYQHFDEGSSVGIILSPKQDPKAEYSHPIGPQYLNFYQK